MSISPIISIIIPTHREEDYLSQTLDRIVENASGPYQIIVVDASEDNITQQLVQTHPAEVLYIRSTIKQRAHQLNLGASYARSDMLLFLHADCLVPGSFDQLILMAIARGAAFGQFSLRFDGGPAVLKLHERGSQKQSLVSGGGDQGLWITHAMFKELHGYNESFNCMEDYELYDRAKKRAKAVVIQDAILTSARKYQRYSYLRVQLYNLLLMVLYKGTGSARLVNRVV